MLAFYEQYQIIQLLTSYGPAYFNDRIAFLRFDATKFRAISLDAICCLFNVRVRRLFSVVLLLLLQQKLVLKVNGLHMFYILSV